MRIAICEDEPLIAEAWRVQLEAVGHVVVSVTDRPDRCLDACDDSPPDLALVDLQLADGFRGEPLVDALADRGIPSIIVSAQRKFTRTDTRARGILRKSGRFREMLQAIRLVEWTLGLDRLRDGDPEEEPADGSAEAR